MVHAGLMPARLPLLGGLLQALGRRSCHCSVAIGTAGEVGQGQTATSTGPGLPHSTLQGWGSQGIESRVVHDGRMAAGAVAAWVGCRGGGQVCAAAAGAVWMPTSAMLHACSTLIPCQRLGGEERAAQHGWHANLEIVCSAVMHVVASAHTDFRPAPCPSSAGAVPQSHACEWP